MSTFCWFRSLNRRAFGLLANLQPPWNIDQQQPYVNDRPQAAGSQPWHAHVLLYRPQQHASFSEYALTTAWYSVSGQFVNGTTDWLQVGRPDVQDAPHLHPGLPQPSHPACHRHSSASLFCYPLQDFKALYKYCIIIIIIIVIIIIMPRVCKPTTRTNFADRAFRCSYCTTTLPLTVFIQQNFAADFSSFIV